MSARDQMPRVQLAAAIMSAAGVGALGILLFPRTLAPWPVSLPVLLLAGLIGAVSALAAFRGSKLFPIFALFLPALRVALVLLRHGLSSWPAGGLEWLTGDDFPVWAGAAALIALQAGVIVSSYSKMTPRAQFFRRGAAAEAAAGAAEGLHYSEVDYAGRGHERVTRTILWPLAPGTLVFTAVNQPQAETLPVAICALIYLAGGIYLIGLVNGRRLKVEWLEEGVAVVPGLEERWWRGFSRLWWPLLLSASGFLAAIFFLLPIGFRLINPALLGLSLFPAGPQNLPIHPIKPGGSFIRAPYTQGGVLGGLSLILNILFYIVALAALATLVTAAVMVLGRMLSRIKHWFKGFGAIWQAWLGFLRSFMRSPSGRHSGNHQAAYARERTGDRARLFKRTWPASPLRALFARLAIWGRSQGGLVLPSSTPVEIGEELAALLPDCRKDLVLLVDGYELERYGEIKPNRQQLNEYRAAWHRAIGGKVKTMKEFE